MQYIEFMPVDADYYVNPDGSVQSLYYEGRVLGFRTISGETFEWNILRTADVPLDTTYFFGNPIAPGEYWWTRWELQFSTNESRDLSIATLYSWGGFYDGRRQTFTVQPVLKLSRHLSAGIDYTRNEVQLPSGSFAADEAGISCSYGFTPMLNLSILGQWNNEDEEMSMNCRLHWIPKIGSDVYIVLNQAFDASGSVKPSESTVIAKVAYWFVI
jgi:hypothetical protein